MDKYIFIQDYDLSVNHRYFRSGYEHITESIWSCKFKKGNIINASEIGTTPDVLFVTFKKEKGVGYSNIPNHLLKKYDGSDDLTIIESTEADITPPHFIYCKKCKSNQFCLEGLITYSGVVANETIGKKYLCPNCDKESLKQFDVSNRRLKWIKFIIENRLDIWNLKYSSLDRDDLMLINEHLYGKK